VALVVATGAYGGFLAWDTSYYTGSDGHLHGPYRPWQVIVVVIVLAVLAAVGGWLSEVWPVVATATVVMTVGFSVSGATSSHNDGLWPIGSLLVLLGTAAGMSAVAVSTDALRGHTQANERSTLH
jgi:hypothetical protein